MAIRMCRAVCLDVHGVLFERGGKDVPSPEEGAEIGRRNHAECYRQGVQRALGGNVELTIDAQALWENQERAFGIVPHEDSHGRVRHHREFIEAVNLRTLELHFPDLMIHLPDVMKRRIAHTIRKLRRDSLRSYVMYLDMREFFEWVHTRGIPIYLVTGLERKRLRMLMNQCDARVERDLIARVFSASELGANKLSSRFWTEILRHIGVEPHEAIVVGNSMPIDSSCTKVGIPAIILDRGGSQEAFYRPGDAQSRYGIRLLGLGDDIPPRAPFIGFAKTPKELRQWLECLGVRRDNGNGVTA